MMVAVSAKNMRLIDDQDVLVAGRANAAGARRVG